MNKGMIIAGFSTLIVVVLSFAIMSGSTNSMVNGAYAVSDANNCSDDPNDTFYNRTDGGCYNASGASTFNLLYTAEEFNLPISSMFSPTGATMVIVMAGLFLGIGGYILYRFKSGSN